MPKDCYCEGSTKCTLCLKKDPRNFCGSGLPAKKLDIDRGMYRFAIEGDTWYDNIGLHTSINKLDIT